MLIEYPAQMAGFWSDLGKAAKDTGEMLTGVTLAKAVTGGVANIVTSAGQAGSTVLQTLRPPQPPASSILDTFGLGGGMPMPSSAPRSNLLPLAVLGVAVVGLVVVVATRKKRSGT